LEPPTKDAIKQQVKDEVQRLLLAGTPRITVNPDSPDRIKIEWADNNPFTPNAAPAGSAAKLLAFLFPTQMYAALLSGIEGLPDGISAAERAERKAKLEQRLLALEREEESLIEQALSAGLVGVERRPTASGWAILGLEPLPPDAPVAEAAE
jgi:hypothetical protein